MNCLREASADTLTNAASTGLARLQLPRHFTPISMFVGETCRCPQGVQRRAIPSSIGQCFSCTFGLLTNWCSWDGFGDAVTFCDLAPADTTLAEELIVHQVSFVKLGVPNGCELPNLPFWKYPPKRKQVRISPTRRGVQSAVEHRQ